MKTLFHIKFHTYIVMINFVQNRISMLFKINPQFQSISKEIKNIFLDFDNSGKEFVNGKRNTIKIFEVDDLNVNVKSFKIPNKINQFVYRFFRKSKARRSFEFANLLLKKGIGTPQPIGFMELYGGMGLQRSFYASEHQTCNLTFRELVEIPDYPDHENILRQFVQFCFQMHEAGIEFKDHSPGNTLIEKVGEGQYKFYLVDLNRMRFHDKMNIELRMKNLSRLTPKKEMVEVMCDEYAKVSGYEVSKLTEMLWSYTSKFQDKYHRKIRMKQKLKIK